jgi:phosphatidylglycerol:prolipoprotein diacylglycerol transferase
VLPTGILYPCPEQAAAGTVSYPPLTTGFHPLFFYESALNVLGAIVALLLARKLAHRLRDGDLVALWFIWYGAVRTVLETLRSGWNWTAGGIAVAQMFGIAAILVGVVILLTRSRRRRWTEPTGAEVTAGAPPRDDALAPGSATT